MLEVHVFFCFFIQTLQSALAIRHHVMTLEDKLSKIKDDLKSAKKEQGRLNGVAAKEKDKVVTLEADKMKLSADVAALTDDNEALSAEVVELKASLTRV